jgi:hypothetical protein
MPTQRVSILKAGQPTLFASPFNRPTVNFKALGCHETNFGFDDSQPCQVLPIHYVIFSPTERRRDK